MKHTTHTAAIKKQAKKHGSKHASKPATHTKAEAEHIEKYHPHTPQLTTALEGATFPAAPAHLIETAKSNDATDDIIQRLGNLSADEYPDLKSVIESVGL